MKAKEDLFSAKKQEMLQDLEYFKLNKAYAIGYLWTQVCDKQPHLIDAQLIDRYCFETPPPPPPSDWPTYCKRNSLPEIPWVPSRGNERRRSLASTVYIGLKHLFQWNPKRNEYLEFRE
jgi:hypothetical protein